MTANRAKQTVTLRACAKINCGLSVLGLRSDGYHELRTIYQAISLADTVTVRLAKANRRKHVSLILSGLPVPSGNENLAARAAEALLARLRLQADVSISLFKRIPPGSGLGGASSDAAAVLRAIASLLPSRAWRSEAPIHLLLEVAASLGSDVPFFLVGGRALGVGRGEEVYPLPESPRQAVVVAVPEEPVSTPEAYRELRAAPLTLSGARPTIGLFSAAALDPRGTAVANDFEPVIFRRIPLLAAVKRRLLRCGASVASLSGSGSAVYGLFADASLAREAAEALRGRSLQVFTARTVARGELHARLSAAKAG